MILLKHRRFTLLFVMLIVWTMLPAFASAASKITLRGGTDAPLKIFAGHSYALSVSGRNVKWYTSNKSVATIGVTTGRLCPSAPEPSPSQPKTEKPAKPSQPKPSRFFCAQAAFPSSLKR